MPLSAEEPSFISKHSIPTKIITKLAKHSTTTVPFFNSNRSSVARRASLPDRRDLRKRDFSKRQFREWFDPISRRHEFLEREARRSGLPLRIRVVATLERLPIVTPDIPKWEKEYYALRAELDRYRACYPKELGMGDPMDEKVLSEEELYGECNKCLGIG